MNTEQTSETISTSTPSCLLISSWYFVSYGSLAYKYVLSIPGWLPNRSNNAFVLPDPEHPIPY